MNKATSQTTRDLREIRRWVEERNGKPSIVKGTEDANGDGGVLKINFPGYSGEESLQEVSWDEWYKIFKSRGLEFLYQDKTTGGNESRFFKLINKKE